MTVNEYYYTLTYYLVTNRHCRIHLRQTTPQTARLAGGNGGLGIMNPSVSTVSGYRVSQAVYIAAKLGIADLLGEPRQYLADCITT
jgi:hypothetical protein